MPTKQQKAILKRNREHTKRLIALIKELLITPLEDSLKMIYEVEHHQKDIKSYIKHGEKVSKRVLEVLK